ncbi:efflux transporter outer membrane subunit [Sphingomonas sp. UYP23]
MSDAMRSALAGLLLASLAGCDLARAYVRPPSPIPTHFSQVDGASANVAGPAILSKRLNHLIDRALSDNRDLRLAVEAAASAQAQFRAQRSAERPTLAVGAGGTSLPLGDNSTIASKSTYTTIGESSFELDLFSRLKNLSRAAFTDYLASAQGTMAARLAVRSEVGQAFVTFAADKDLLKVARQTADAGGQALDITTRRYGAGLASGSDIQNAVIILKQAQADELEQVTRVEQDRDALQFVVGGTISPDEEPLSLDTLETTIATVDAGISSAVLLRRPDVRQAEYQLQAAGLRVGAARAAFFPTASLSSVVGFAGTGLANLFAGRAASLIVTPAVGAPILGGPVRANLAQARAQQASALATYEKAIQGGFRDASDGLARKETIGAERAAQGGVVTAAAEAYRLSLLRFKAGEGTFLAALVDQQTLYGARRRQIDLAGIDLKNRITLAASLAVL